MADASDPRAVRSRAALLRVAAGIVDDDGSQDPSVTELASRAGVSRPTFYQHFADVPALMAAAVTAELAAAFTESDDVLRDDTGAEFLRGTIRMLVRRLHDRHRAYRRVVRGPAGFDVLSAIIDYVSMRMRENVLGAILAERRDRIDPDRITATAAGAVWLVVRWLDTEFTGADAPAVFAERLTDLMLDLSGFPDPDPA